MLDALSQWFVRQGLNILFIIAAVMILVLGIYWLAMKKAE